MLYSTISFIKSRSMMRDLVVWGVHKDFQCCNAVYNSLQVFINPLDRCIKHVVHRRLQHHLGFILALQQLRIKQSKSLPSWSGLHLHHCSVLKRCLLMQLTLNFINLINIIDVQILQRGVHLLEAGDDSNVGHGEISYKSNNFNTETTLYYQLLSNAHPTNA